MKKSVFFISGLILLSAMSIFGTGNEDFEFIVYPTGAIEAAARFSYSGLVLILDSGYVSHNYYRDESGAPLMAPADEDVLDRTAVPMIPINWSLGLEKGLIPNEEADGNLLAAFVSYDGRHEILLPDEDSAAQPFFLSAAPAEAAGLTESAVTAGLLFDDSDFNTHQVFKGINGKGGVIYAPGIFNELSDYYRLFLDFKFYIPLFDAETDDDFNIFNIYLASRFKAGWIGGTYLPQHARQKNMTEIRGIRNERYNSRLTCTNNTEIRFQFPAFLSPGLLPAAFIYFDSAYHWEDPSYNGFLASTGCGGGINVFNFLLLGIRTDYNLLQTTLEGLRFKPIELNIVFQFY